MPFYCGLSLLHLLCLWPLIDGLEPLCLHWSMGMGIPWITRIHANFLLPLASGLRFVLFNHNWHDILKDECRNTFVWFSKYCGWFFFRIFIFQQLMSIVFCEAVFLLLDCQLFAFTLNCFTVHVYEWYGNGNDPVGIPREWECDLDLAVGLGRNGNWLYGNRNGGNVKICSRSSLVCMLSSRLCICVCMHLRVHP